MRNLACGNLTHTEEGLQLRKLVTNNWGQVSPELALESWVGWEAIDLGGLYIVRKLRFRKLGRPSN